MLFAIWSLTTLADDGSFVACTDLFMPGASAVEYPAETQEKSFLRKKIFFQMSLMTKLTLTLTLTDPCDNV